MTSRPGSLGPLLIVALFLIPGLVNVPVGNVEADASDWGEQIGNVLRTGSWGHGSGTNISTVNVTASGGSYELVKRTGWFNLTAMDLKDGSYSYTILNPDDEIALVASAPAWTANGNWDLVSPDNIYGNPAFGDFDGDGDLDLYMGVDTGDIEFFNNTGDRTDAAWSDQDSRDHDAVSSFAVPTSADLDNDGDLDLLVGCSDGIAHGFNNTGTTALPVWTSHSAWDSVNTTLDTGPELGDLDGDGDFDLLLGTNSDTFAYRNDGNAWAPSWTDVSGTWSPPAQGNIIVDPALGDLDNDGDLDLLLGRSDGYTRAYENTGSASSPVWTRRAGWDPERQIFPGDEFVAPDLADLDADGDLDLMLGDALGFGNAYENTGDYNSDGYFYSAVLDAGHTANWSVIKWDETLPSNTDVTIATRSGNTSTPDGTWSGWSAGLSSPLSSDLTSPPSRYLQIRAYLQTGDGSVTPTVTDLKVSYWAHDPVGTIETADLAPQDLVGWKVFTNTSDQGSELITIRYSTNSGGSWTAVPADGNMSGAATAPGKIRFRVTMTSIKRFVTPQWTGMTLTYMTLLAPHHVHLAPAAKTVVAGSTVQFTAELHDINNNTLVVTPQWATDIGSIDTSGNLSGLTAVGTGNVTVTVGGKTARAQVTVQHGTVASVVIDPMDVVLKEGGTAAFTAEVFDQYENPVPEAAVIWTTDVGTLDASTGRGVNLTVKQLSDPLFPVNETGYVTASVGQVSASANVTIWADILTTLDIDPKKIVVEHDMTAFFEVAGKDQAGNVMDVDLDWSSDIGLMSPANGPNSTFTPSIESGSGTVTATVGNLVVSANVTVTKEVIVRTLTRLVVSPSNATIKPGQTQVFTVTGHDQFDAVMNVSANWSCDIGTMTPSLGKTSIFSPNVKEGKGTVTAAIGTIGATAVIEVEANATYPYPEIKGIVPDQTMPEDSPPWIFDLNTFEGGGVTDDDMVWYVEGLDMSIVRVMGEYDKKDKLTFVTVPDASGSMELTYVLMDGLGYKDSVKAWVHITPVNDAPTINPVPDLMIRFGADFKFNYLPYIWDRDSNVDDLSLEVTGTEPSDRPFEVKVDGFNIIYNAPEEMLGESVIVTFTVSDGDNEVSESVKLTVTDNWVPQLNKPLPDVTIKEGETLIGVFDLDDFFLDQDSDVLYYSYGNNHVGVVINEDHSVDIKADIEWSGTELVTFRATDSKGALVEDDSMMIVLPVDDSPVIDGVPDVTVTYDMVFSFDLSPYIMDVDTPADGLSLTFSEEQVWWAWDPDRIAADPPRQGVSLLTMSLKYPEELGGLKAPYTRSLKITVSDGRGSSTQEISVLVTDNVPPGMRSVLPDVEFYEDTKLSDAFWLDAYFFDPDGPSVSFTTRSRLLTVDIGSDHMVDISAPRDWFGTETVTFRASDIDGAIAEDTILVSVLPVNDAPTLDYIPNIEMDERNVTIVELRSLISDVDDDPASLTIGVEVSDDGISAFVSGTDVVVFGTVPGDYTVTVTVTDPGDETVSQQFNVKVNEVESVAQAEPTASQSFMTLWPVFLLIFLIIGAVGAVAAHRRYYGSYTIDEAFVIIRDGRPISHVSRKPVSKKDKTVFSGMVAAIQIFVEDAFVDTDLGSGNSVQRMEYKGYNILIEQGNYTYLALLFKGTPGIKLTKDMHDVLKDIEDRHGETLVDWSGDLDEGTGITEQLMVFVPHGISTRNDDPTQGPF